MRLLSSSLPLRRRWRVERETDDVTTRGQRPVSRPYRPHAVALAHSKIHEPGDMPVVVRVLHVRSIYMTRIPTEPKKPLMTL